MGGGKAKRNAELACPPSAPAVGPAALGVNLSGSFLAEVVQKTGEQHGLVGDGKRNFPQPMQADIRVGRDEIEVPVNGGGHGGEDREEGKGLDGDSFAPAGA